MIIYLDQNKWIDLARICHGKDKNKNSIGLYKRLASAVEKNEVSLPLSAIHYMECGRISNAGRRERLGNVMWQLSKGMTLCSYEKIVTHESEVALSKIYSQVQTSSLDLLGFGISHAFGEEFEDHFSTIHELEFEKACITGCSELIGNIPPFYGRKHAEKFRDHLAKLHTIKERLPRGQWGDFLRVLSLSDVITPFSDVMHQNGLSYADFEKLRKEEIFELVQSMPSRALDIHLSSQVLKKNDYNPKITDMEDWAGVGVGAQYCDVVVCEKHMADMLGRDRFVSKAVIFRNITQLESILPS